MGFFEMFLGAVICAEGTDIMYFFLIDEFEFRHRGRLAFIFRVE